MREMTAACPFKLGRQRIHDCTFRLGKLGQGVIYLLVQPGRCAARERVPKKGLVLPLLVKAVEQLVEAIGRELSDPQVGFEYVCHAPLRKALVGHFAEFPYEDTHGDALGPQRCHTLQERTAQGLPRPIDTGLRRHGPGRRRDLSVMGSPVQPGGPGT